MRADPIDLSELDDITDADLGEWIPEPEPQWPPA
jgi:hypothetical protein